MEISEERPFTLIQFLLRGRQPRSVEIVPWKWISWNEGRKKCVVKYPNPPYTAESLKEIQRLTENLDEAPDDWPMFNISLKGSASTYSDALAKLDILERYENAFTSDDSASVKEEVLQKALRQKKLKMDEAKLREILAVESDAHSLINSTPKRKVNLINKKLTNTDKLLENTSTKSNVETSLVSSIVNAGACQKPGLKTKKKAEASKRTSASKAGDIYRSQSSNSTNVNTGAIPKPTKQAADSRGTSASKAGDIYRSQSSNSTNVNTGAIPKPTKQAADSRGTSASKAGDIYRSQSSNSTNVNTGAIPKPTKQAADSRVVETSASETCDVNRSQSSNSTNVNTGVISKPMKQASVSRGTSASKIPEVIRSPSSNILSPDANNNNKIADRSEKYKKIAASVRGNSYEKLVERVELLRREESTSEDVTVLVLCESILLMLNDVREDVRAIKRNRYIGTGVTAPTYDIARHIGFCEEYQVALPFETTQEFFSFDKRLKFDESLHTSFLQYLSLQFVVDHGLPKIIASILKVVFTRDVAMEFTAVKKVKNKHIIKETVFTLCFYDTVCKRRLEHNITTSEKEFYTALGVQLTNSKDWFGQRSERRVVTSSQKNESNINDENNEATVVDDNNDQNNRDDRNEGDDGGDRVERDDGNDRDDESDGDNGDDEHDENDNVHKDHENFEDFDLQNDIIDIEQLDLYDMIARPF